eukprot:gb/GEZN01011639.1/.p1 GENE.gb/GEZN01011639.1/~~gb/GEZN01011639.1/.p1  ORF type:complete len:155 (+),score=14.99 gb/GEZN01011639.1/:55-519(+)
MSTRAVLGTSRGWSPRAWSPNLAIARNGNYQRQRLIGSPNTHDRVIARASTNFHTSRDYLCPSNCSDWVALVKHYRLHNLSEQELKQSFDDFNTDKSGVLKPIDIFKLVDDYDERPPKIPTEMIYNALDPLHLKEISFPSFVSAVQAVKGTFAT